jgi:hypothetical protein
MAENKLKALASRAFLLWRVVHLFRDVGFRGIPSATNHVSEQTARILDALDPATQIISEINQPDFRRTVLEDAVAAAGSAALSAIDKTSLVLAHSILDEVATECCRISAAVAEGEWTPYVGQRKVTLTDALGTPAPDLARRLLSEYLEQLGRDPLFRRLETLNRHCQPAPAFQYNGEPYAFDGDRLIAIDRHRQRIIHQLEFSGSDPQVILEDLRYVEATCFFFIFILGSKQGFVADPNQDSLNNLASTSSNPVRLAYEGLLLATSLPTAEERIWTYGGRIFAAGTNRQVRQLPILIPAATPDLSADRSQIAFVKQRPRPVDEPYAGHFYGRAETPVGDIWVSRVDGSDAQMVLRGGQHPEITSPIPQLPRELEGIMSPKFSPDSRHVYFIADAWTTSGAIYRLDLPSREVTYFTDGNVFVVLHGEPCRGHMLVLKHRYFGPPNYGSFDHFWLMSPDAQEGDDLGETVGGALERLYGAEWRVRAFPHLA